MNADDLTVKTVRDGAVCTLILGGALDLLAADEFLQQAARVLDDRIERLVLDLAGVTFLDCAGVRALAIATCFAPGGCPVIIRSLSPPARRIITMLGTDEIENLRRLTAGLHPRDGLRDGVASVRELAPVTWGELDLTRKRQPEPARSRERRPTCTPAATGSPSKAIWAEQAAPRSRNSPSHATMATRRSSPT